MPSCNVRSIQRTIDTRSQKVTNHRRLVVSSYRSDARNHAELIIHRPPRFPPFNSLAPSSPDPLPEAFVSVFSAGELTARHRLHPRTDPHLLDHLLFLHHQPPGLQNLLQCFENTLERRLGAFLLREAGNGDVGAAAAVEEGVELGGDGKRGDVESCDYVSPVAAYGHMCWDEKGTCLGMEEGVNDEALRTMDERRNGTYRSWHQP